MTVEHSEPPINPKKGLVALLTTNGNDIVRFVHESDPKPEEPQDQQPSDPQEEGPQETN